MNKKVAIAFGILLIAAFAIFTYLGRDLPTPQHISGQTMGAIVYNVKFIGQPDEGLKSEIDNLLQRFNQSLSTYIADSEISIFNNLGSLQYSSGYFYPVMERSKYVYEKTNGAFDPTVGPLVKAWGFGPDKVLPDLDSATVDSLLTRVGFEAIHFDSTGVEMPPDYNLDFSAIAKGYAVDLVGELLERKGYINYLVEIGGEVRCRGVNEQEKSWSLGIEDPTVSQHEQRLLAIVRLKDMALATSGNYRNYYEKEGRIYAHIIDPRTGYTAQHSLLSASVFAPDCMTADAYATAFMVLGLEASREIIETEEIEAFLVYQENGELKSYISEGILPYIELNKAK